MIKRKLKNKIINALGAFPTVAILGPRQCGKSTLAKDIISNIDNSIYVDLEKPSDVEMLTDMSLFLNSNKNKLICFDEIQRMPEIFSILRTFIDENKRNGQFLILGSASPELLRQSSESLAGRIVYYELTPFLYSEVKKHCDFSEYWLRGGFPRSILAKNNNLSME